MKSVCIKKFEVKNRKKLRIIVNWYFHKLYDHYNIFEYLYILYLNKYTFEYIIKFLNNYISSYYY